MFYPEVSIPRSRELKMEEIEPEEEQKNQHHFSEIAES